MFEEKPKRAVCDPKFCDLCRIYVFEKSHLKPLKGGNKNKKNGRKEKRRKDYRR